MVNSKRKRSSGAKSGNTTKQRAAPDAAPAPLAYDVEVVAIGDLRPHPRNYKKHPEAQLEHIAESLRAHDFYKNVVVARDGTILAGHGVVEAAKKIGRTHVPVRRLGVGPDDPTALKVIAADNELGRFAESDDRALTEMLRSIAEEAPGGLFGTGYDEQMLAALVMVTRPESEIRNFDAATEWIGMPEFEPVTKRQFILTVQCLSEKAREEAAAKLGLTNPRKMQQDKIWTGWYPEAEAERNDLSSLEWSAAKSNGSEKKTNGKASRAAAEKKVEKKVEKKPNGRARTKADGKAVST